MKKLNELINLKKDKENNENNENKETSSNDNKAKSIKIDLPSFKINNKNSAEDESKSEPKTIEIGLPSFKIKNKDSNKDSEEKTDKKNQDAKINLPNFMTKKNENSVKFEDFDFDSYIAKYKIGASK